VKEEGRRKGGRPKRMKPRHWRRRPVARRSFGGVVVKREVSVMRTPVREYAISMVEKRKPAPIAVTPRTAWT